MISYDQLVWLAAHEGTAAVVVANPRDASSEKMLATAQRAGSQAHAIIYVYEPARDAEDGDLATLIQKLREDGLADLEGLNPGTLLLLGRVPVGPDGSTASASSSTIDRGRAAAAIGQTFRSDYRS